jgi:CheY-like chemotaxis protein
MDHMMPEMDGVETTSNIRKLGGKFKEIPIIALTANAIAGNEEIFLNSGFQAFIAKPIDIMLLDSVIRHWIRDKSMEGKHNDQQAEAEEQSDADFQQEEQKERRSGTERRSWRVKQESGVAAAIPGLDLDGCLERFGGDEEVLWEILESYVRNTPAMLEKIRTVTQEKLGDYAVILRGIKGSSHNVCAQAVGDFAQELEQAAKTGDFASIEAKNGAFLQAVEEQIVQISEFLKHGNRV